MADAHGCPLDGLACGGIQRDDALLVPWQMLQHHPYVADVVELAIHLGGRLCLDLQQIDANRQSWQNKRVFEKLIVFVQAVMTGLCQFGQLGEQGLQFLVVGGVGEVAPERVVTVYFGAIDVHGQLRNAAQVFQLDHLFAVGDEHFVLHRCRELPVGKPLASIAQHVYTLPLSPFAEGMVYVGHSLLGRDILEVGHPLIARYGYLGCLSQVTIALYQRVKAFQLPFGCLRIDLRL